MHRYFHFNVEYYKDEHIAAAYQRSNFYFRQTSNAPQNGIYTNLGRRYGKNKILILNKLIISTDKVITTVSINYYNQSLRNQNATSEVFYLTSGGINNVVKMLKYYSVLFFIFINFGKRNYILLRY